MRISLPDEQGRMADYTLTGTPIAAAVLGGDAARVVYSAAHVVADPFAATDPSGQAAVDWNKTMAFRRHLAGLGLGIDRLRRHSLGGGDLGRRQMLARNQPQHIKTASDLARIDPAVEPVG